MPTVMVTTTCQNACPWCFARSKMEQYRSQGIEEMNWRDFTAVVEFYERSDFRHVTLLGGEPTMHSRFFDMLAYLASRGFSTIVVTNGIIPASLVDALVEERFPNLRFSVNSTSYFDHGPDTRQTIDYFLRNIPNPVGLSYIVTQRDLLQKNVHPILDRLFLIMKFGLGPHLQCLIALPSHGSSDFVPFDLYPAVVELLQSWTRVLQKNWVHFVGGCHCIPPCCVPPGDRLLFPSRSACKDFMIDIGPNLEAWPCYPLSAETVRLERFHTLYELRDFFLNQGSTEPLLYEDSCQTCRERLSKACDCGCRGFQILRKAP